MKRIIVLLLSVAAIVFVSAELEILPEYWRSWPEPFHNQFFGVFAWQWIGLGIILGTCWAAGIVVRYLTRRLTVLRDQFVPHPMLEPTRLSISRSAGLLCGALFASAMIPDLKLELHNRPFVTNLEYGINAIEIVAGILLIYGFWDAICDTIAARATGHERAERLLVPMMRKFVRALIIVGGIVWAINVYFGTKTLTGLIAGLGVTGLVVALAAKDSVENVFGSLTILFDMPFAIGDWVKIDAVQGTVEQINLRSTRIRTAQDTLINLPNANLIRAAVENFGARRFRVQKLTIRLSFASDPDGIERFCEALREYLDSQPQVAKGKTLVDLDEPTESSVGVVVTWNLKTTSAA
ncbi:MAG TPA: mechanosensitive ion channel domain-containing protein, partial [Fimbriimonas sp.]|nr:mechanosensitive ion channel domain-containing protein [Fimbriimonas sp.]